MKRTTFAILIQVLIIAVAAAKFVSAVLVATDARVAFLPLAFLFLR